MVALALASCLVAWRILLVRHRFQRNMSLVHQGMTRDEVVHILGQPKEFKRPCYAKGPNCDQDLVYSLPFDFVSFWTISLDQSGHVVETFHWESP